MKQKLVLLIIALMLVFGAGAANAAVGTSSLEILPGGSADVTGESTVFFDVVFNPQGTIVTEGYTFNMFYDDTELTWNSGLTTTSAPIPLFSQLLGPLDGTTSGFIGNFNATALIGAATLSAPFTLAQLAFDVNISGVNAPVGDGSPDVWFDTREDVRYAFNFGGIGGSNILMSEMVISGTSPDIAVAPEPVSSTLFIIGAATLGFRRFRKVKN
jgi:hypothetical protein